MLGLVASASSAVPASPAAPSATDVGSSVAFCAEEINRYRESIGRPPLTRSRALEDFATDAARNDAAVRVPHHHFAATNGAGVARAETEMLRWRDASVASVVQRGLAQMWKAGPGGKHYDIIAGPFTEIGCGVSVDGNEITVAQDFR